MTPSTRRPMHGRVAGGQGGRAVDQDLVIDGGGPIDQFGESPTGEQFRRIGGPDAARQNVELVDPRRLNQS